MPIESSESKNSGTESFLDKSSQVELWGKDSL
jgi:hypothetical protein